MQVPIIQDLNTMNNLVIDPNAKVPLKERKKERKKERRKD
jgi:hypothetical protein